MSEDLISRKAAIDAIWDGTNMDIYTREVKEILEGLPSAPPVCIAKVTFDKAEMEKIIEDLVEQIEISVTDFADSCQECGKIMNEKLNNTQQKTGWWIQKEEEGDAEPFIIWECSECHCVCEDGKPSYKYCPQCGCKMEVEE